ncbi:hypothetical protein V8E54_009174 [Elaphomyces granulatus]
MGHTIAKLKSFTIQPISSLSPYSALILSMVMIVLFFVKYYVLENFLLQKLYKSIYSNLNGRNRRGFVNHHIAGVTKILILIFAFYPFVAVISAHAEFQTPLCKYSIVKMGDILLIASQMLIGIYIFELIYRTNLSPVAVLHHIGTIIIGQSAIVITLHSQLQRDSDLEFILCTVWGAFDIVSEFLPHVAIILYRIYPKRHNFLRRLFLCSCITTLSGTTIETIVIMYLFGSLWTQWRLAFKIVTPLLHLLFSATQLHGSLVFFKMCQKQERLLTCKAEPGSEEQKIEP